MEGSLRRKGLGNNSTLVWNHRVLDAAGFNSEYEYMVLHCS